MENILSYVHFRKDLSFETRPFNTIDLLILAELSYVDWRGIIPAEGISLHQACTLYFERHTDQEIEERYAFSKNIPHLVKSLQRAVRYQKIQMIDFQEVFDEEKLIQFAAVTFQIPDGTYIISYRGTDGSIVGWKENMQMTYMDHLPCHQLALDYLEHQCQKWDVKQSLFPFHRKKTPKVLVTGHSKGGNLAMYASMMTLSYAPWIHQVVVFDAPGFRSSFYTNWTDNGVFSHILNIKPKDTVIGNLLEHREKELIIDADASGLLQHDPFFWKVNTDSFYPLSRVSAQSVKTLDLIDKLLLQKNDSDKKDYIDLIFSIMDRLDITNVSNLSDISLGQMFLGVLELKNMSSEERKFIFDIVNFLRHQTSSWMKTQKKKDTR